MALSPPEFVVAWPTLFVAADWVEAHCVVPDGFRKGERFDLADWQAWCLLNHYRVRPTAQLVSSSGDPVPAVGAPAFHNRRSQIVLPQKAGKGPLTAAQICLEGVGPALFAGWAHGGEVYDCRDHGCGCGWMYEYQPGEPMGTHWPTPLIQITAVSEEQTGNVYDVLRPMIESGPLADVIPRTGEEFIRLPGGGRIDVVTSSAQSRLGQRVTFVPQDETQLWTPSNKMTKVADTQRRGLAGMGGRAVETTNAWDPAENSVAQQTADSRSADIFRFHPQAPTGLSYRNKQERRRIHRHVYRGSRWVDLDAIEAEAAELLERDPGQAERFFGNRVVAGLNAWLPDGLWERAQKPQDVPDGTRICLGFDGSDTDDWTVIRAETLDGYGFTPSFSPDRLPSAWNPVEAGGRVPRAEVHAAVDEMFARYRVVRMYCDPPLWQSEVEGWAAQYGEQVVLPWATYRPAQMHSALERTVTDLSTHRLTHDGCPITAQHIRNARKAARPGQRYVLEKPAQHQKIDLAMGVALAHEAASDAVAAGALQVTDRRVIVFR